MCWSSHSKKLMECYRVAEEDVPVIKVMLEKVDCAGQFYYLSFFRGHVYIPKKAYVQPDAFSYNVTKFSDKNNVDIAIGFHSYSRECKFVKIMQNLLHVYSPDETHVCEYYPFEIGNLVLIDCIIPKGTPYYINERGEYVSSNITIVGETDLKAMGIDIPELNSTK